jgi:hypothetical protein
MKLTKVLAVTALLGLAATSAQAIPTGSIGVSGVTGDVYSLDWAVGNALAKGAVPLQNGQDFTLYYQATLANFVGSNSPITANGGLNSAYELTIVGGITEKTQLLDPADAKFSLDTTSPGAVNFFTIYKSPVNANNLAGTGFTDGTIVMQGKATSATGNFGVDFAALALLDSHGTDQWGGQQTISGNGSTKISVDVTSYDSTYFTTPIGSFLWDLEFNTSNILPYNQVEPSHLFTDAAGNPITPSIGPVNGLTGPDIMFQADGSASPVVTPEPSTMVLLGAGLFGMSVFARRRKQS